MTTETPPDWVLLEAAKRGDMLHWGLEQLQTIYKTGCIFTALCDMIAKHEKRPVDRKLLCAREARDSTRAEATTVAIAIRAIELWEEGFGK
jgi:hypothetical protein